MQSGEYIPGGIEMIKGYLYQVVMRLAHRFNWHYAPPIYLDGDKVIRCEWCGFSQVIIQCKKVSLGSVAEYHRGIQGG